MDTLQVDLNGPRVHRHLRRSQNVVEHAQLFPIMGTALYFVGSRNEGNGLEPGPVLMYHHDRSRRLIGREPETDQEQHFDLFRFGLHEAERAVDRIPASLKRFAVDRMEYTEESVQRLMYFALTDGDLQHSPTTTQIAALAARKLGHPSYLRNEHVIKAQNMLHGAERIIDSLDRSNMGDRLLFKHESVLKALEARETEMRSIGIALNPRRAHLAACVDAVVKLTEQNGRVALQALSSDTKLQTHMREHYVRWREIGEHLADCVVHPYSRIVTVMSGAFFTAYIGALEGDEQKVRNALLTIVSASRIPRIRRKQANILAPIALTRVCGVPIDWDEAIDEAQEMYATLSQEGATLNAPHVTEAAGLTSDAITALRARDAHTSYTLFVAAGDKMDGFYRPKKRK